MKESFNFETEESRERVEFEGLLKNIESMDAVPFSGVTEKAKTEAQESFEMMPEIFVDPADLFERFEEQGMKVYTDKSRAIGNIFIVPGESTDVQGDGIRLKEFLVENITNPELRRMVEIARKY